MRTRGSMTYQGNPNFSAFGTDDPGTARDGNQIAGSFALSWAGNAYHSSVTTTNVFPIQTGGSSSDRYTALSADSFKSLFEEHVLLNSVNQIDVVRPAQPTQWMGFSYNYFPSRGFGRRCSSTDLLYCSHVRVDESVRGTEIVGKKP